MTAASELGARCSLLLGDCQCHNPKLPQFIWVKVLNIKADSSVRLLLSNMNKYKIIQHVQYTLTKTCTGLAYTRRAKQVVSDERESCQLLNKLYSSARKTIQKYVAEIRVCLLRCSHAHGLSVLKETNIVQFRHCSTQDLASRHKK